MEFMTPVHRWDIKVFRPSQYCAFSLFSLVCWLFQLALTFSIFTTRFFFIFIKYKWNSVVPLQKYLPKLISSSPSVWITSTNMASVGSSRTPGSVFSKLGPAGSRPVKMNYIYNVFYLFYDIVLQYNTILHKIIQNTTFSILF